MKGICLVLIALTGSFAAGGAVKAGGTMFGSYWLGRPAPEITGSEIVWASGGPLTLSKLRGRVVLLDVWDFTCVNCLRTLPYLKEWDRRYRRLGLTVIGVHCPEFEFAKNPALVKKAAERLGLKYPIVCDNGFEIWSAFHNSVWPRKWLVDAKGVVRLDHSGEGDYRETELMIQELLRDVSPGARFPLPVAAVRPEDEAGAVCYPRSAELYLGYERGAFGGGNGGIKADSPALYSPPAFLREGEFYLKGVWKIGRQYSLSIGSQGTAPSLLLRWRGTELNCVLSPEDEEEIRVKVALDNSPLKASERGRDVFESGGETWVTVDSPRMYEIVKTENYGIRDLSMEAQGPGLACYAFTFGSCVVRPR